MSPAGVIALIVGIVAAAVLFNVVVLACPGLLLGYVLLGLLGSWWVQALVRKAGR